MCKWSNHCLHHLLHSKRDTDHILRHTGHSYQLVSYNFSSTIDVALLFVCCLILCKHLRLSDVNKHTYLLTYLASTGWQVWQWLVQRRQHTWAVSTQNVQRRWSPLDVLRAGRWLWRHRRQQASDLVDRDWLKWRQLRTWVYDHVANTWRADVCSVAVMLSRMRFTLSMKNWLNVETSLAHSASSKTDLLLVVYKCLSHSPGGADIARHFVQLASDPVGPRLHCSWCYHVTINDSHALSVGAKINDLGWPWTAVTHYCTKRVFRSPTTKIWILSAAKMYSPMTLLSGNIRFLCEHSRGSVKARFPYRNFIFS